METEQRVAWIDMDEVRGLRSGDYEGYDVTEIENMMVKDYGHRQSHRSTGMPWISYLNAMGEALMAAMESGVWPFPPIRVMNGTLYDGHHRVMVALKLGWEAPIPMRYESTISYSGS